jgi:hypothetical protein
MRDDPQEYHSDLDLAGKRSSRLKERRRLKRAEQRDMPIKLLRTDMAALLAQRDFRDKVIAVLRQVSLLPPKPGPDKGDLRLVKLPKPKN